MNKILRNQIILSSIIIIFGSLIITSYLYFPMKYNIKMEELWYHVPEALIPLIKVFIITAGIVFLILAYSIIVKHKEKITYITFIAYLMILLPSTFWMYFSIKYIQTKLRVWKMLTILTLFIVSLGSILLCHLSFYKDTISFISAIFFTIQTTVWDVAIWGYYFIK